MELLENLNWRYATKKFDPTKNVSEADLETIKEAIRLSASSYGLQLYKVLVVKNPELRAKLRPVTWNQPQVTDASHLIVFCNYTSVIPDHIDDYLKLKAKTQELDLDSLKGYGDFIKNKMAEVTDAYKSDWTSRQVYIALGNLLSACAELKIDACPMEGFEPEKYNEILSLKEQGLNAVVVAAIGYRSAEDQSQYAVKVRKSKELLFETV